MNRLGELYYNFYQFLCGQYPYLITKDLFVDLRLFFNGNSLLLVKKTMRLTLVIYSITSGGAERVMSNMANYWAGKGWDITLLTFTECTSTFYKLDSRIAHIPLDIGINSPNAIMAVWNNLKGIRKLRSALVDSKADAIISFLDKTNVVTIISSRGLNIPLIISDRNQRGKSHSHIWQRLCNWTYPFANRVILQTERAKNEYSSKIQQLISVIPNPVLLPEHDKIIIPKTIGERSIIAVGRLERQKGFDLLLNAFAKIKDKHPGWKLTILGEGSLRSEIESLCNQLELTERVYLPGQVKNPYAYLAAADLFVMSSRHEGFPNALCEAMACGLPVISTDCPYGPREIIRDGIDGILVANEDVPALGSAMDYLMSCELEQKNLGIKAQEIIVRFGLDKIMEAWEKNLMEVII
jgi:GalNAc-alpha-(1->4)-GalNAc-alpha-(1->3)-diNAcBac-PP-undecaprenol alpha-1,4-N-acetyl-D-galactosaminyltransferase